MAESSIGERMKAIRTALNLSQQAFAKGIYLSNSFYGKMEIGHRKPNERVYELISNKYKVNKEWIKTGKGQMFSENPPDVELIQLMDIIKELDPLFRNYIVKQIKMLAELHTANKKRGSKSQCGGLTGLMGL
jgi:transcriptional regulator with XRE-family HTH domain